MPMPKSWSEKKRLELDGKPHQQKPDIDNLQKSIQDALAIEDSYIWDAHCTKYWGRDGSITIEELNE